MFALDLGGFRLYVCFGDGKCFVACFEIKSNLIIKVIIIIIIIQM